MGFFTTTQAELAAGRSVFYAELYHADFVSEPGFYWDAFGDLDLYDETWIGAATVVSRSEIPFTIDDEAGKLTLTMSGVDEAVVERVRAAEEEVVGRELTIWGQFFDEGLQPVDDRFFLFGGTMDVPTYLAVSGSRAIEIPCEGEFSDRNEAAFAMFSDRDQRRRFPGDKGCERFIIYKPGVRRVWPLIDAF